MILVTIIRIRSRSIIVNVIRTEYGSHQLQQELIDRTESRQNYDDLVEEILLLREQQEQTNMDEAAKAEHRDRIQALCNFINSQPRTIQWQGVTSELPYYLNDEDLVQVTDLAASVTEKIKSQRINGVIEMFSALTDEEKQECLRRLQSLN